MRLAGGVAIAGGQLAGPSLENWWKRGWGDMLGRGGNQMEQELEAGLSVRPVERLVPEGGWRGGDGRVRGDAATRERGVEGGRERLTHEVAHAQPTRAERTPRLWPGDSDTRVSLRAVRRGLRRASTRWWRPERPELRETQAGLARAGAGGAGAGRPSVHVRATSCPALAAR